MSGKQWNKFMFAMLKEADGFKLISLTSRVKTALGL